VDVVNNAARLADWCRFGGCKKGMESMTKQFAIKAENVGPVRQLDVTVAPGLNVLRGANGSGKSTLLTAVNYALTKTGDKPTPRDGTRAGKLEAFGVCCTFTSRATLKGSLEVESLSGRLDLGDLIAPGYEDEAVNDARRIKRLIELSGAQATVSMFAGLLAGMKIGSLPTDLIDAADFVKRLLQERAREQEAVAERQQANAAAARQAAVGVDVTAETDAERLQEAYTEAAADLARLVQQKVETDQRKAQAKTARTNLEEAKSSCALTKGAALLAVESARGDVRRFQQEVDTLRDALQRAEHNRDIAVAKLESCETQFLQADDYAKSMAVWEQQIAAAERLEPVDQLAIDVRKTAVATARKAMETGALARKAKEQLAAAEEFDAVAKASTKAAEKLRANAAATDDVLAAELQRIGCPWRPIDVPKGSGTVRRLVVGHRRGEQTLVSDLSEGERAKHAIDVALSLAGKSDRPAVLILRQEVFEGLQPAVRAMIDQHAQERGVVILTAEATDDDEVTL
jgi:DNA repair exonuclease SbcCD ATPase subunit